MPLYAPKENIETIMRFNLTLHLESERCERRIAILRRRRPGLAIILVLQNAIHVYRLWPPLFQPKMLSKACDMLLLKLLSSSRYHHLCGAKDKPQNSTSRYGKMIPPALTEVYDAKVSVSAAQGPDQKWFHSLIWLIFWESLKRDAMSDYGVAITSATLSRLTWLFNIRVA
ncbi:hypothetical protein MBM_06047 [Drepanopeziza brunnea f. sp. 'multigermtubi' MB_m1]|uniref:Uncharacterized protein n=1 Tax=Marssonina brunnea f. sp. multigermtubi (strain MB_m1) TaxID=1072389 RepID=K1WSJ8_MARBU|nr:uncharacterized protein MBM_06047 [Drepanopeziza brunnea f. sp. 'multigermtubi' MB_m1]EKD16036.1 hypothetical protein MBM_06047 [Drepanopeziza brunnea f. sp. 'multigermtubi' MB_m1]